MAAMAGCCMMPHGPDVPSAAPPPAPSPSLQVSRPLPLPLHLPKDSVLLVLSPTLPPACFRLAQPFFSPAAGPRQGADGAGRSRFSSWVRVAPSGRCLCAARRLPEGARLEKQQWQPTRQVTLAGQGEGSGPGSGSGRGNLWGKCPEPVPGAQPKLGALPTPLPHTEVSTRAWEFRGETLLL